jgi:hypothetical protein
MAVSHEPRRIRATEINRAAVTIEIGILWFFLNTSPNPLRTLPIAIGPLWFFPNSYQNPLWISVAKTHPNLKHYLIRL